MTCNTCNECNPCEENKKTCCELKVLAGDCVDVEEVDGQYVVSATCPPRVIPGEGVEVEESPSTKEGYSIDYKVSATDKKVGVCSNDTPGYLTTKIKGQLPIKVETIGCENADGYMLIKLDEDALDVADEKVAVGPGCEGDYLENVLEVDSNVIKAQKVGCKLRITDKLPQRAYGRLTLADDIVYNGLKGGDQMTFVLSNTSIHPEFHPSWTQNYLVNTEYNEVGGLRIKQRGLYVVGYTGSLEFAFGIHGARIQLYAIGSLGSTKPILESRYSAPIGEEPYLVEINGTSMLSSNVTDAGLKKLNFPVVAKTTHATGASGKSASMGAYLARVPFGGSTILELEPGDTIYLGGKMQSAVEYKGGLLQYDDEDGYNEFAILGGGGGVAGPNYGTSIYAAMICPL